MIKFILNRSENNSSFSGSLIVEYIYLIITYFLFIRKVIQIYRICIYLNYYYLFDYYF
jgi:hypothetical protein